MALHITSLNSGSNGNCYYLANEEDAILVDVGLNCRETEKRMARLGLSMNKVRAIFISHEHSDHISGLPVIARKYQLPVYITPGTLSGGRLTLQEELVRTFNAHECIHIGELVITAFPKLHDASEPHSFIVSCREVTVGVFTDIGFPCENLVKYFKKCHAAFLEANYDEQMLDNGRYPYFLKKRIRGGHGHLSNKQAFELFTSCKPPYMSHLLLSHLSRDNNSPDLVLELFKRRAGETEIVVASRDRETKIYYIESVESGKLKVEVERKPTTDLAIPAMNVPVLEHVQYSLFQ
ncbi:MBL fold metallo-hydrolase [Daejeonella sp.]|uniref:MBL fold metallo-hydrolase n=1 Tax=Daejeonella sp. TaxID=2805397 RepID=UPI0030C16738